MIINWNCYAIELTYDGSRFHAHRLDDDKKWTQNWPCGWHDVYNQLERDEALVTRLEQAVRDWQALHKSAPRPTRQRVRMGDQVRPLPVVRPKAREWKGEAR